LQLTHSKLSLFKTLNPLYSREKVLADFEKQIESILGILFLFYKSRDFKFAKYPNNALMARIERHAGYMFEPEKYVEYVVVADSLLESGHDDVINVCKAVGDSLAVAELFDNIYNLVFSTIEMFIAPLHAYFDDGWFNFPRYVTGQVMIDRDSDLLYVKKYNVRSLRTRSFTVRIPIVDEDVVVVTRHISDGVMIFGTFKVLEISAQCKYTAQLEKSMSGSIVVAVSDAAILGMHVGGISLGRDTFGIFSHFKRLRRIAM